MNSEFSLLKKSEHSWRWSGSDSRSINLALEHVRKVSLPDEATEVDITILFLERSFLRVAYFLMHLESLRVELELAVPTLD